jgi:ubiquinone biosynthesis monooxygenase Coq7
MNALDPWIITADNSLRTLSGAVRSARPRPKAAQASDQKAATEADRQLAGALMRVNHVGEVCAQALYEAQALATRNPQLRAHMQQAAREEVDHLAWTAERLAELKSRPSLLNPLWFAGAFTIGLAAGKAGDRWSLGFMAETERQVEQHLNGHLDRLPAADAASRAIVTQMRDDEARHAASALEQGGIELPSPIRWLMRGAAKVMTAVAHHV